MVLSTLSFFSPGTVYLEEKTRPSQPLSTSSDVSVKLEVEDRKLGSSQLFETSPRSNETKEKNQQCQYITVSGVTYKSSPVHPPSAIQLYSQPPPLVDSSFNARPIKKPVSIACLECRDRKVKVCLCGLTFNRLLSFLPSSAFLQPMRNLLAVLGARKRMSSAET